jgi:signal transduction histidine kinase
MRNTLRKFGSDVEMNKDQISTFALSRDRDRFRHLSGYLLREREVERGRIAKELHDKIGQGLTAVVLHLPAMESKETSKIESLLAQVAQVVEVPLTRVNELSRGLRLQLERLGLGATLKW